MSPSLPVAFFATEGGTEPVREWLKNELTRAEARKVSEKIATTAIGWPMGMPVCRPMGAGLFEVRVSLRGRIARVLFCIHDGSVVLLHGFVKKTQATPKADLRLARKRMAQLEG